MISISAIAFAGWSPAATILTGDHTITGNLSVVQGIDFGTAVAPVPVMEGEPPQTQAAVELSYIGGGTKTSYFDLIDELATFHLRDSRFYSGGRSKMKLDAANILTLYKNTGVTGMTFNSDTGQLNLTGTGSLTSYGPGVFANGLPVFTVGTGGSVAFGNRTFTIANTTAATSSSTGALTVMGGIGVAKDSYFNGVRVGRGNGSDSTLVGNSALQNNTGGYRNSAFGSSSLSSNTTGSQNTAFGNSALGANLTGSNNVAIGHNSGTYSSSGYISATENSIYIGASSMGFSSADQNSIVIGASAIGEGDNTTVIGTIATTKTHLYGTTETGGLVVDGQTLLKGQVILESPQGDIPMFTGN